MPDYINTGSVSLALAIIVPLIQLGIDRLRRSGKDLCWSVRTQTIIRSRPDVYGDLLVSYKGLQVQDLSISRVVIWNRGNSAIHDRDLDTGEVGRLRLRAIGSTQILALDKIAENNVGSDVSMDLRPDGTEAIVNFRYLNNGHGAVFQVVHSGTGRNNLVLEGDVRDVKCLSRIEGTKPRITKKRIKEELSYPRVLGRWPVAVYGAFLAYLAARDYVMDDSGETRSRPSLMLVMYAGTAMMWAITFIAPRIRKQLPAGLEVFLSDIEYLKR